MAWGKGLDNINNTELKDLVRLGFQQFLPARVVSIDQSENLTNGNVVCEILSPLSTNPNQRQINASPLFANNKSYPLVNEVVFLITGPTGDYSTNSNKVKYYYLSTLKIWDSIHTNPTPNPFQNLSPDSQNKSIAEIEAGSTNKSGEEDTNKFKPGTYFQEKSNIYPLYPFEGDIIYEGRWGNSIRFGSTNIRVEGGNKTQTRSNSFQSKENFTSGNVNPTTLNSQLSIASSQVRQFQNQYDNVTVTTIVTSAESKVPNPSNIPQGGIAQQRLNNTLSILSSFPLLNSNIITETVIGTTPFVSGIDNPNDIKYTNEQYVTINVSVRGTETINSPEQEIPLNDWSVTGSAGDPLIFFRNGQNPSLPPPAQSTTLEDINQDLSSLYLTSTQKIPLEVSSKNDYLSYGENKPADPNQYSGAQVILNSGRLLFNSTQDHIMLSSKKSINLNALDGINIDTTGPIILEGSEVALGSRDATESVLLGDSTVDLLQNLISDLVSLLNIMGTQIGNNGIILEPTATTARTISNNLATYQTQLDSLKSNIVRVE